MRRSMGIQSVLPCLVLICSTARVTRSRQTTYSSTSSRDGCSRARKVMRSLNSGCRSRKRSKATNPRMMFLLRSRRSTRSSRNSRRRRSRLRSSAAMRRAAAALQEVHGVVPRVKGDDVVAEQALEHGCAHVRGEYEPRIALRPGDVHELMDEGARDGGAHQRRDAVEVVVVEHDEGAGPGALVMLHDYHLYGVAPLVRAAVPGAFIHQFVHIPWAQSDAWLVLPEQMRTSVFAGLLGNDIVAFHTRHYAVNFLQGCRDLLDLEVDERRLAVAYGDREVWVRAYPVSIDPEELRKAATAQRVAAEERNLLQRRREFLLLRVDRLDLSKNVIRGFVAFDRFLDLHPEFKDRITFLALLQPSREDVEEYVVYRERVTAAVEQINTKHGNTDWMPIDLRIEDNFPQTLAAYRHYDALMAVSYTHLTLPTNREV